MLLAEISVAGTLIVVILAAIAAHAASLGDAVRMLTAMTRIEVLALTAGIAVPWVILRCLLGLPMPQFRAKPQPTIDALMLEPAPFADTGVEQPDDGREPQPRSERRSFSDPTGGNLRPWQPYRPSADAAHSIAGADEIDFKIHGQEMQFVEIELDPGESAIAEAGSMMFKDADRPHGHDLRRRHPGADRLLRQARRGRQADADRREPVHDRVHPPGRRQGARVVRRALSRHHPAVQADRCRRHADRPEGRVPVRRQGRFDRHLLPAQDHDRPVRRRRLHHAEAARATATPSSTSAAASCSAIWRRARNCTSTPAASRR